MQFNGHENNGRGLTPDQVPATLINRMIVDPASRVPGAPPLFGADAVPHVFTVTGRYGLVARAYSNHHDEAIYHDPENARIMRNEPAIMECLESRMRCTAMLNWHITPITDDSLDYRDPMKQVVVEKLKGQLRPKQAKWDARELASKMTHILHHSHRFTQLRYWLMEALWFGRSGAAIQYGTRQICGSSRTIIRKWEPRHGDKFVFRYDDGSRKFDPDQFGIRVGPGWELVNKRYRDFMGVEHDKVEPTQHGLVYWFDPNEQRAIALHKHIIEDGDFHEPHKAGSIHGVGIRSRIYWTWWAYQECLKLLLEYTERSALGIEIWKFPAHNPQAKAAAETAARERGPTGRSILMVPVPEGEMSQLYGVEIVEPGLGGLNELKDILQTFFGHKIKRYILGQTLTSEAEGTGLGSGVADAHLATLADIVRFDANNLEETLTDLVRVMQLWNFPGSDDIYLRFHIDTESDDSAAKLSAFQAAWNMGLKLKSNDLYDIIGSSKPTDGDDVLTNPMMAKPAESSFPPWQPAPPPPAMIGPMEGNPLGGQPPTSPPVIFASDGQIERFAQVEFSWDADHPRETKPHVERFAFGWPRMAVVGTSEQVRRCENCGRGLTKAVVCSVIDSDGSLTTEYHYFGSDCAAKLAGKKEKEVEEEAERGDKRRGVRSPKHHEPSPGQMELLLQYQADLLSEIERLAAEQQLELNFGNPSARNPVSKPPEASAEDPKDLADENLNDFQKRLKRYLNLKQQGIREGWLGQPVSSRSKYAACQSLSGV